MKYLLTVLMESLAVFGAVHLAAAHMADKGEKKVDTRLTTFVL